MQYFHQSKSVRNVIPLNAEVLDRCDRQQIENAIRTIVRNVHFEFLEHQRAVRLLGPDMYYHAIDPELPAALGQFDRKMTVADILSYRSSDDIFDLCFEDSWSGYFIANRLQGGCCSGNLVLIHLDDHTDMMPTLLEVSRNGTLANPVAGTPFDPKSPADWELAIYSGAVGIGCFITPLFFAGDAVHIRHLNNCAVVQAHSCSVIKEACEYELIPSKRFASVRLSDAIEFPAAGSYLSSSRAEEVLDALPPGRVIVHIDFDFFINDFNGNPREGAYVPPPTLIAEAQQKLDRFFQALCTRNVQVDRWILATSPGFCSACHWTWLLSTLTKKIQTYCRY